MTDLNWISYYMDYDGYGRFSSRMVKALQKRGLDVKAATMDHREMPPWLQKQEGINWDALTISFLPPYLLKPVPGEQWLFSMTEGSRLPDEWVKCIKHSGITRIIVPCSHNKAAFEESGVEVPVNVVIGGTDPLEFPSWYHYRGVESITGATPYTFLTFADRGFRKGWEEVWKAFYLAFGGKTQGDKTVRLLIKCRPGGNEALDFMRAAGEADIRIQYEVSTIPDLWPLFTEVDCLVLPSRSEGWGMIQREAAMSGLPVITQAFSGLNDGSTERWAMCVNQGRMGKIPDDVAVALGEWKIVDVDALAQAMKFCRYSPETAAGVGKRGSSWLSKHQTWDNSADQLIRLMRREHGERVYPVERRTLQVPG